MKINLKSINLNYLIILDALLEERQVTAAAIKLKLKQPTVSNILKQLRLIFEDELLSLGQSKRMTLTQKARSLRLPVKKVISELEDIFQSEKFTPLNTKIIFTLAMSDYISLIVLKKLMMKLSKNYPNIKLNIIPFNDIKTFEEFENRNLDLLIGNLKNPSKQFKIYKLFTDRYVCIADKNHPGFQKSKLTFNTLKDYPYLMTTIQQSINDFSVHNAMKKFHFEKIPTIKINNIPLALNIIAVTEYYSIVPKIIASMYADKQKLTYKNFTWDIPELPIYMYWKPVDNEDTAHIWLRDLICKNIQKI
ncbi:MAG TPA: LysR family transcriptional regulator [Victivallales bacterium]|nr:LysR family transcriptional regulator [Victivallales bacterium]